MRTEPENSSVPPAPDTSPPWRVDLFDGPVVARAGHPRGERIKVVNAAFVLAYLACPPRRSHPRETLITLLWPDAPPDVGRNRLSFLLTALRKENGLPLEADRHDVTLPASLVSCDIDDFLLSLAHADAAGDDDALRATHLSAAVAASAGEFLPGLFQDWVIEERRRLTDRRIRALCDLSACRSRLGEAEDAISLARQAIALDPWDERGHDALLRALISAGRSAAATRHYRELEARWRADFGEELPASLTPGYPLGAPLSLAREGESGNEGGVSIAGAPVAATGSNLELPPLSLAREGGRGGERIPLPLTRFFGREAELRLLEARIAPPTANTPPARLVTLLGSGGSGKTRLALEAASLLRESETFGGSVYFVPLADTLPTPDALSGAIRAALPSQAAAGNAAAGTGDAVSAVAAALGATPVLLVLDNFEHMAEVEAVTDFLTRLLTASPRLSLLVTSRQHLDIEGEQEIAVPPLPTAAAGEPATLETLAAAPGAQLLLDRMQAVRPGFALTAENAPVVAALCERLEGIPLAIVLCAAWAGTLSPTQMLDRLRNRFDLLVSRRKDIPERHRTLRATVEYSFQQLTPDLARLLTGLSVFRGGWTLEAAEAVCASAPAPAPTPSPDPSPLSRSPRRAEGRGENAKTSGFSPLPPAENPLLESRVGVFPRLRGEGPGEGAGEGPGDSPPEDRDSPPEDRDSPPEDRDSPPEDRDSPPEDRDSPPEDRDSPPEDRDSPPEDRDSPPGDRNTLAALDILRERSLIVADEAGPDSPDHAMRYRMLETLREFAQILAPTAHQMEAERRHATYFLAFAEEAEPHLSGPDQAAWLSRLQTEHDNLRAALQWCLDAGDADQGLRLAIALRGFWETRGFLAEGVDWLLRLKALPHAIHIPGKLQADTLLAEGRLILRQGHSERAGSLAEEALSFFEATGDETGAAIAWNDIGNASNVRRNAENAEKARRAYERSLELSRRAGNDSLAASALSNLGMCDFNDQHWESAGTQFHEALAIFVRLGHRRLQLNVLNNLGATSWHLGAQDEAIIYLNEALAIRRALGIRDVLAMVNLAQVYFESKHASEDDGRFDRARHLLREAISIASETGQRPSIANALRALGNLDGAQERWAQAIYRHGAAAALREALQIALRASEQQELDEAMTTARVALGDAATDAAWLAGRRAPLENVIASALLD